METSQAKRLWVIIAGLVAATIIVSGRLVVFQVLHGDEWADRGRNASNIEIIAKPNRGIIYDRNGAVLAGNGADYQIGSSPNLITDDRMGEVATALAPVLEQPVNTILDKLSLNRGFVMLSEGRVPAEKAEFIRSLEYEGIQVDPLARRIYPQGELMCHLLGYTDFDGVGGAGIEGYYQQQLAGEAASAEVTISPLEEQINVVAREGSDLVLTLDRTIQHVVEKKLREALAEFNSRSGSIIVMNPKTGAILAMANYPCYNPYTYFDAPKEVLNNPAVSRQFEPGSVMKLVTMAIALDAGAVGPQSTYYDAGIFEIGGIPIYNWDRSANGVTDMKTAIARSLNVGMATIASMTGAETYYNYMQRFGFGRRTGIDLMSEAAGQLLLPGNELWTEAALGTNSFGQGLAVTPLQMISSVAAIANKGYLMQPYLVEEIHAPNGEVFVHEPKVLAKPISEETANEVTAMAVYAVNTNLFYAQMDGYTVAGKSGTAQIPENGIYHPTDTIASFIGWLPADDPEVIILVKIDRPQNSPWGSETAAPTFSALAEELVVLLDIPPDAIRLQADIIAARSHN